MLSSTDHRQQAFALSCLMSAHGRCLKNFSLCTPGSTMCPGVLARSESAVCDRRRNGSVSGPLSLPCQSLSCSSLASW